MSTSYNTDHEIIEVILEGHYPIEEAKRCMKDAISAALCPLPVLVNVSMSREAKPPGELQQFLQVLVDNKNKIIPRFAIYVDSVVHYLNARLVAAFLINKGIECRPFFDRDKSLQWLKQVSEDAIEVDTPHFTPETIIGLLGEVDRVLGAATQEDLSNKADASDFEGEWRSLVEHTNDLISAFMLQSDELQRSVHRSEAANQAKSMFLSNISHELRSPLNAILGFAELMARDSTISKQQRNQISIISRSGKHLLSLINDILDIAKIETGRETLNIKSFDFSALLSEVSELFYSRIIDKGLFFTLEINDDLPRYIKSDEGKLRRVFINLLSNALKYTEEGGVTLRVSPGALAEDIQTLLIEVEDTGIGIESDRLESVFDPFVQAGQVRSGLEGTGLGLSICKALIELLSGEISVESKPGEGSLFRVDLAVALAESAEASGIEKAGPAVLGLEPGQSAWRILVVEDNFENRLLLDSLLLPVGFATRQAENGEEAVTLFKQWQPHFIWMDIRMPMLDGCHATARIRSLPGGDRVKIVAITASAFREQRQSILEAGCDEVVYKPFQAHEIFETMREQLGVRYTYDEEIDKPSSSAEKVINIALAREMAASLPEPLFDELEQAAMSLDMEATYEVLERIAEIQPELAGLLRMRVEEADFSAIKRVLNHE